MKTAEQVSVDEEVGAQLYEARRAMGMAQKDLGAAIGVNRQQVGKYESGDNAMSSGRLVRAAHALGVPLTYLFSTVSPAHAKEHRLVARYLSIQSKHRSKFLRAVQEVTERYL